MLLFWLQSMPWTLNLDAHIARMSHLQKSVRFAFTYRRYQSNGER